MKNLTATICLAIAVLLGSAGMSFALPPCPSEKNPTTSPWSECSGTWVDKGGNKYVGEFRDGKENGQGTFTYANGSKYVGEFRDGKPDGQGIQTHAAGSKYVGEFGDGKPNGQGTYTYANGSKCVGEFRDGKPDGQGTYTHANGSKYTGELRDGKPDGQGIQTHANGSKYVGEFRDGKPNGQGIQTHAAGSKYAGEFRDGKPNGQGTYNYVNGIVKEGIFKDGKFQIAQKVTPSVIPKQDVKKTARQPSSKAVIDDQFRVALVIGNGDYGSMGTLRNPVNDAQLMTKTLENLGFVVIEEINATQKRMKKAVKRFSARLDKGGDNSVGLFYFAGHGMSSSGLNYLIPVDANIDVEGDISIESVAANDVLLSMEYARARVNFIILDACRNNPFVRGFRSATRGLARMVSPKGSLIAYATSPGGVAIDGDGKNSPYTLALTTAMKEGDPVERMFRNVRNKVMAVTKEMQTPWETSSLIGDDFFFSRREKSN